MKITVTESIFKEQFKACGREDNFSHVGLSALFEYCEDREQDIGEEWELDVIALCCGFSESHYSEIAHDYGVSGDFEEILEYLEDETLVIHVNEETGYILYQDF